MTSDAIGGPLEGADLVELPGAEKATWADWRRAHPDTRVLSIDGAEHVDHNPYDTYFSSDSTFRDLEVDDDRLSPKAPIFAFWHAGRPVAIAHEAFAGGGIFHLGEEDRVLLHRPEGASIFASTGAWRISSSVAADADAGGLVAAIEAGRARGVEALPGFDTFWYNWVAVHPNTLLLD